MPSTDTKPVGGLAAEAEAAGMSLRDLRDDLRAWRQQWEAEHPEEVEAARLKEENARLQHELAQSKVREAEAARTRENHRETIIGSAVYFGGYFLLWLLFSGACPSCAWNGAATASWWDVLAMYAYLGWGIIGLVAGFCVAEELRWRRPPKGGRGTGA
ncbi:MAG TPA: hypothetical protein VNF04_06935 [Stellaceae bacterium]|nr:hypothetical protein [Stellaceae bacterium]